MDTNSEQYQNDPRTPCKYGKGCYQKNPIHWKKFKHPKSPPGSDKKNEEVVSTSQSPPHKKIKVSLSAESPPHDREDPQISSEEECSTADGDDDNDDLLQSSPIDDRENIKQKFLVDMPEDFYDLWKFFKSEDPNKPEDAFSLLGLRLVGPYDILNGKLKTLDKKKRTQSSYLCHWRFYHDPPEFQTVLVGKENDFHMGYFRDDPSELPVFVASMSNVKKETVTVLGPNMFAALHSYISSCVEKSDPFSRAGLQKKLKSLEDYSKKYDISLEKKSAAMKARDKKVVAKSFHGAGIVVPINKSTDVGYREIPETNASLRKILKNISDAPDELSRERRFETLQEILTNVQWGMDEGDFGMGLELGIDLLVFGGEAFHSTITHLLSVAYELLDRNTFGLIMKAHLKNRRKGSNLSILS